jgi:hypothetical protein
VIRLGLEARDGVASGNHREPHLVHGVGDHSPFLTTIAAKTFLGWLLISGGIAPALGVLEQT